MERSSERLPQLLNKLHSVLGEHATASAKSCREVAEGLGNVYGPIFLVNPVCPVLLEPGLLAQAQGCAPTIYTRYARDVGLATVPAPFRNLLQLFHNISERLWNIQTGRQSFQQGC